MPVPMQSQVLTIKAARVGNVPLARAHAPGYHNGDGDGVPPRPPFG
jgi:hypothetical protein